MSAPIAIVRGSSEAAEKGILMRSGEVFHVFKDIDTMLQQSSTHDQNAEEVWVTRLFLYYRGDFGSRRGIYEFLERYDIIDQGSRPRMRYDQYDWTLHGDRYRDAHT